MIAENNYENPGYQSKIRSIRLNRADPAENKLQSAENFLHIRDMLKEE
jgi:hypothetical protein